MPACESLVRGRRHQREKGTASHLRLLKLPRTSARVATAMAKASAPLAGLFLGCHSPAAPPPAFEIAVRRVEGAALARLQPVGVHGLAMTMCGFACSRLQRILHGEGAEAAPPGCRPAAVPAVRLHLVNRRVFREERA